MRELMARVKALLRRVRLDQEAVGKNDVGEVLQSGDLKIDKNRREAFLKEQPLVLKPKEYELLLYLIEHRSQALSREKILEQVWGWEFAGGSRTVDVHISWLREKIEPDPQQPQRLVTVRGLGYRFEG
jgi:DNA-binding response OmpR family regulator